MTGCFVGARSGRVVAMLRESMGPAIIKFAAFDRHVLGWCRRTTADDDGRSGGGGTAGRWSDNAGLVRTMESGVTSSKSTNSLLISQLEFGFE